MRSLCSATLALGFLLPAGPEAADGAAVRSISAVGIVRPIEGAPFRPVFTEAEIRERLRSFVGKPCDPPSIQEALARRYRFLGYVPTIEATCDDGSLSVYVRESSHLIVLVTFDPEDLSQIDLKPEPDYEETHHLFPVPRGGPRALLLGLLETRVGDLYNFERYRSDRAAIGRLGYTIAFIAGAARGPQAYPPGAYLIQSLKPPTQESPYYQRTTNYLGGTGSYEPRAGSTVGLVYQKDQVFGNFDRLNVAPYYNTSTGGDLSYRAPVLSSHEAPLRLYDTGFDLFSDFRHNRSLDGVLTDERRSGAGALFGIRPLSLKAPNDLRLEVGLRYERVRLGSNAPPSDNENLTILRLGAAQEWRHTYRWPSLSLRFAPSIDFSVDRLGGQRSFVRPGLDLTLHSRLPSGFETDFHLVGGAIDRQVPSEELYSLGGPMSVRGFREDSFLGRNLAVLQSELWIPLFRPRFERRGIDQSDSDDEAPFEPRASRLLRGALFVDGGSLTGTTDGRNEAILGAGVGLRLAVPRQPLVIRIDYGFGLGAEGGRSYPYVSLAYRF